MCFSPAASFVVSGVLATASVAIAQRKVPKRERAIAALPFIFAIQQFLEGVVWLFLNDPGPIRMIGVYGFTSFAYLLWPTYVPIAMLQVETNPARKKLISLTLVAGLAAAVFFLYQMVTSGTDVVVVQECLQYQMYMPWQIGLLYWTGANGAFLFSSNPWWVGAGVLFTLGALIAGLAYPFAIASIWCYFAAVASLTVALYFFTKQSR